MEAGVTEGLCQVPEMHSGRVRDDRLTRLLDDPVVVRSGGRSASGEASRGSAFGQGAHELREPLVGFEPVDPSA
jgi:hypothetical protein